MADDCLLASCLLACSAAAGVVGDDQVRRVIADRLTYCRPAACGDVFFFKLDHKSFYGILNVSQSVDQSQKQSVSRWWCAYGVWSSGGDDRERERIMLIRLMNGGRGRREL